MYNNLPFSGNNHYCSLVDSILCMKVYAINKKRKLIHKGVSTIFKKPI